ISFAKESKKDSEVLKNIIEYFENANPNDLKLVKTFEKYSDKINLLRHSSFEYPANKNTPIQQIALQESDQIFQSKIKWSGFGDTMLDNDDIIRKIPLVYTYNAKIHESFSASIAHQYLTDNPDISLNYHDNIFNFTKNPKIDIPTTDYLQMYINFHGEPYKSFPYLSFIDVYNNNFDKNLVKDKIALIGVTSALFQDRQLVPTSDTSKMPGVEIHANAIQTILDQDFLQDQSRIGQIATIFGVALICCLAFMYFGILPSVLFFLIAGGAYTFIAKFSFDHGIILNMVYPYLAIILSFISIYLYRYFTEIKQKKQIETAFSRYVNPTIVKKISDNPEQINLGGQSKEITIFFSDIQNFTNFSEKLDAQVLVKLLNEYFEVMGKIILENHGTLDKYEGDAIMAFWNAPLDVADHAYFACKSALAQREKLQYLKDKWSQNYGDIFAEKGIDINSLEYRIGLNTGIAVIGNVGSKDRIDYTAMGDSVNLASRLEGINKQYKTHICLSENTYEKIKDQFEVRKLDKIRVKGKDIPITIYELLSEKGGLPEPAILAIQNFEKGFEYYQQKNFIEAQNYFNQVLTARPNDDPSKVFLARCQAFSQTPPLENWDGVWTYKVK
ncbi:hypothetical protein A2335_04550, partial [Candidatus Peregrinibacteria bacterium RIFOXYB2_FULL_32_7]